MQPERTLTFLPTTLPPVSSHQDCCVHSRLGGRDYLFFSFDTSLHVNALKVLSAESNNQYVFLFLKVVAVLKRRFNKRAFRLCVMCVLLCSCKWDDSSVPVQGIVKFRGHFEATIRQIIVYHLQIGLSLCVCVSVCVCARARLCLYVHVCVHLCVCGLK